jgi:hypothetical protein
MDVAEKEQFTAERNEPYHFFGRCIWSLFVIVHTS